MLVHSSVHHGNVPTATRGRPYKIVNSTGTSRHRQKNYVRLIRYVRDGNFFVAPSAADCTHMEVICSGLCVKGVTPRIKYVLGLVESYLLESTVSSIDADGKKTPEPPYHHF